MTLVDQWGAVELISGRHSQTTQLEAADLPELRLELRELASAHGCKQVVYGSETLSPPLFEPQSE